MLSCFSSCHQLDQLVLPGRHLQLQRKRMHVPVSFVGGNKMLQSYRLHFSELTEPMEAKAVVDKEGVVRIGKSREVEEKIEKAVFLWQHGPCTVIASHTIHTMSPLHTTPHHTLYHTTQRHTTRSFPPTF